MDVRALVKGGHLPGKNDFKTIGDMKLNEIEIIRHKLQDGWLEKLEDGRLQTEKVHTTCNGSPTDCDVPMSFASTIEDQHDTFRESFRTIIF